MVWRRPGLARMALVITASVGCLALAACTGSSGTTGAALGASGAADPLAGLTGNEIALRAMADVNAASGVTMTGSITQQGETFNVSLAVKPGQGCTGTILDIGKDGSYQLLDIGTTEYVIPDKRFSLATFGAWGRCPACAIDRTSSRRTGCWALSRRGRSPCITAPG